MLPLEQTEFIDRVDLQLIELRNGAAPGVDEGAGETEPSKAAEFLCHSRRSPIRECLEISGTQRELWQNQFPVDLPSHCRMLRPATSVRFGNYPFRHKIQEPIERDPIAFSNLLSTLERLEKKVGQESMTAC